MNQPSLFDAFTPCASRYFGPLCGAEATCECRTGCGGFRPSCDRCAAATERWAASPGLSGLRFDRRPLGVGS